MSLYLTWDVGGRFIEIDFDNSGTTVLHALYRSCVSVFLDALLLTWWGGKFFFLVEVSDFRLFFFFIKVIFRNSIMQSLLQFKYILLYAIKCGDMMLRISLLMLLIILPLYYISLILLNWEPGGFRYTASVVFSSISIEGFLNNLLKLEHSSSFRTLRGSSDPPNRDSLLMFLWLAQVGIILLHIIRILLL